MINIVIKHISVPIIIFVSIKEFFNGIGIINLDSGLVEIFLEWGFSTKGIITLGIISIMCSMLLLVSYTFVWANCLIASKSFLIIFLYLLDSNVKAALLELPLLLMIVTMVYFRYPFLSNIKL
jgi:hypothetical protein